MKATQNEKRLLSYNCSYACLVLKRYFFVPKNALACLVSVQSGFGKFCLKKYYQEKLSILKRDKFYLQQTVDTISVLLAMCSMYQ